MGNARVHLVLIETSGNQRHIFQTNKLKENVGASEQIYRLGLQVVLDAVDQAGGPDLRLPAEADLDAPSPMLDAARNCPINDSHSRVEVWYAASGKALMFVKDWETGRRIIRHVTRHALRQFPGVVVRGAITEPFELTAAQLESQVKSVHVKLEEKRGTLPPPEARFQRLPWVAECQTSGLPASSIVQQGPDAGRVASVAVEAKRGLHRQALQRMQHLVDAAQEVLIAQNIDHLERWLTENRYVAVIHADGTGMGRIFQNFRQFCPTDDPRRYIEDVRAFSLGIDLCTKQAFRRAVQELAQTRADCIDYLDGQGGRKIWKVPLLPLIVGGDDVTVLCGAWIAIPLLVTFFRQFESSVREHPAVQKVARAAFQVPRLGMCAGVSIIKPHYPFFAAYNLAEGLQNSAKRAVKQRLKFKHDERDVVYPCTAFDFHVHQASSGNEIDVVRAELEGEYRAGEQTCRTRLWGGPYIVTDDIEVTGCLATQRDWLAPRTWHRLQARIVCLAQSDPDDDDRRILPNSQMHDVRSALFAGPDAAAVAVQLIQHRYQQGAWNNLLPEGRVFWPEQIDGRTDYVTAFLDAMALSEFAVAMPPQSGDSG